MILIKITHANTSDKGEFFQHTITGHYYSDAMQCEVLVLQGNTFFPIKESWDEIYKQFKGEHSEQ